MALLAGVRVTATVSPSLISSGMFTDEVAMAPCCGDVVGYVRVCVCVCIVPDEADPV